MESITKVIGDEYDEALRDALRDTLIELGADRRQLVRGVAGSQDVEAIEVNIGGRSLFVEAETYVGLTLTGDADLVMAVVSEVSKRLYVKGAE
jgi:hypothetical protein